MPLSTLTRRSVIGGLISLATAPALVGPKFGPLGSPEPEPALSLIRPAGVAVPRFLHAAATLPNGMVLVTGGYPIDPSTGGTMRASPMRSTQIFDPGTQRWFEAAPMSVARARHASALLPDGRVAVLGGYLLREIPAVAIYDPRRDAWEAAGALPMAVADHTVNVVGDFLVVIGANGTVLTLPISSAFDAQY